VTQVGIIAAGTAQDFLGIDGLAESPGHIIAALKAFDAILGACGSGVALITRGLQLGDVGREPTDHSPLALDHLGDTVGDGAEDLGILTRDGELVGDLIVSDRHRNAFVDGTHKLGRGGGIDPVAEGGEALVKPAPEPQPVGGVPRVRDRRQRRHDATAALTTVSPALDNGQPKPLTTAVEPDKHT
jgi:hypothetical protein